MKMERRRIRINVNDNPLTSYIFLTGSIQYDCLVSAFYIIIATADKGSCTMKNMCGVREQSCLNFRFIHQMHLKCAPGLCINLYVLGKLGKLVHKSVMSKSDNILPK